MVFSVDNDCKILLDNTTIHEKVLRLDSDTLIDETSNRIFKIDHLYVISQLRDLTHSFGIKWNFVTVRTGTKFVRNRVSNDGSKYKKFQVEVRRLFVAIAIRLSHSPELVKN